MTRRLLLRAAGILALAGFSSAPGSLASDAVDEIPDGLFDALEWRCIGPAAMGGRITSIAVEPGRPRVFYVGSASGGLFKTENHGTTFRPVFDGEGSSSIGAVAIAPSAPGVVWVGTGEANPRNSVTWGDGVYASADGGETWEHRGLADTRHVGRIAIHPDDPSRVYVAAMGRTWGSNPERGLYRTRDGGATWERVLFVDEQTGCIDVRLDPERPKIVYAITYQRQRDRFDGGDPAIRLGEASALWRSDDGGDRWTQLTSGLPTGPRGRIGLDIHRADPRVLFATVETETTGRGAAVTRRSTERASIGVRGRSHADGFELVGVTENGPAEQAGLRAGDVIQRLGDRAIEDFSTLSQAIAGYRPGDAVEVTFLQEGAASTVRVELQGRRIGGPRINFGAGMQGGQIANAQGEQGEDGFETGGVFRSDDRGDTWTRVNSLNPRPFYYSQIRSDPTEAQRLYVLGISFHSSDDGGETFDTRLGVGTHPDHHDLWIDPEDPEHLILGNDGGLYVSYDRARTWDFVDTLPISQFYNVAVDQRQPYRVYGGLQDNGSWGGPSATRKGIGIETSDWFRVGGGDGFRCAIDPRDPDIVYSESQNGAVTRLDLRTGRRSAIARPPPNEGYRYNWNTPYLLSPHNPDILYFAANVVVRSVDRGRSYRIISPDIALTDRGSATALAQSPRNEDLLYVGTDDGALFVTRDGGQSWRALHDDLPGGVAAPLYVSDIEASPHRAEVVYVALDGHRSDDEGPYLFRSEDAGTTWARLDAGLPYEPIRTIVASPEREGLLFVGTEFGCYVSIDGGASWHRFMSGMPTVPVHDLVIHPRDHDLVAATHGRGIWIVDIAPLAALTPELLQSEQPRLLPIEPAVQWNRRPGGSEYGARRFVGANPDAGAAIYYYLPTDAATEEVEVVIEDPLGAEVRTVTGPGRAGLHRVRWTFGGDPRRGRRVAGIGPGDYVATLRLVDAGGSRLLRVREDPDD